MYTLVELDTIDSTNNWAKREKASFSPDQPTFIVASGQTGGRGRGTNTWLSPKGQNLYMTAVEKVRRTLKVTDYALVALLAMRQLLYSFGVRSNVRWPNDLMIERDKTFEKIGGVLVEGISVGSDPWIIVGIGLNVNMDEALLRSIGQPATSLHRLLPHPPTVHEVKQKAIEAVCEHLALAQKNPELYRKEYCAACSWLIGADAVLQTPLEQLEGTIEGFTLDGYLRFTTGSASPITVPQGVLSQIRFRS